VEADCLQTSDVIRTGALNNREGILAMLAGAASIVVNDAIIKFASQSVPAFQLILVRAAFGTALLLAIGLVLRMPLRGDHLVNGRVLARAGLDVLASVTFVIGIAHMQLANASAIYMATPLIIMVGAVLLFAERASARRWMAIVAGFSGVLLVVQPASAAFNAWSLLMLLSASFTAGRDLVTRSVSVEIPSLVMTLITLVLLIAFSAAWGTIAGWQPMTLQQLGMLALASVFMTSAFFFMTVAIRNGEMAVVAPFRYSTLIFSAILGYVIWGDIPNVLAWCGIALIVGAGIYLVRSRDSRGRVEGRTTLTAVSAIPRRGK
jgi:drug/metabolite transporter (DMT)-like permease